MTKTTRGDIDLSGTLDGAGGVGGVFAMHNAQCIMHNFPGTNEGPPRPRKIRGLTR